MNQHVPRQLSEPDPRRVFVVHGRDDAAKAALFAFLRELDLHPLEWEELVRNTGSVNPFTGEVVAQAFSTAQAVVVLLTPDDEARLYEELQGPSEPDYEVKLTGQPRPNVLLEAGMALGYKPDRTILVELGRLKPVSDLAGRNVIRMSGSPGKLNDLVGRLEAAGCSVNRASSRWLDGGHFMNLAALKRGAPELDPTESGVDAIPSLGVRLSHQGSDDYVLEITNRGGGALRDVRWRVPESAPNWRFSTTLLDKYPVPKLDPNDIVRVPALISSGGPSMVVVEFLVTGPDRQDHSIRKRLSMFDSGGSEWK